MIPLHVAANELTIDEMCSLSNIRPNPLMLTLSGSLARH